MIAICEYCGTLHAGTCWRVKEIEYYPNGGAIKRVLLIDPRYPDPIPVAERKSMSVECEA